MFFESKDWVMNASKDMMFNLKTYRTIRKRIWHDNSKTDGSADFFYFSFHELNASQAVAFLFSSEDDARTVHPQSVENKFNFDMIDLSAWKELEIYFRNGLPDVQSDSFSECGW